MQQQWIAPPDIFYNVSPSVRGARGCLSSRPGVDSEFMTPEYTLHTSLSGTFMVGFLV